MVRVAWCVLGPAILAAALRAEEPNDATIDAAVTRGLAWLAAHQEPCGGWPGDSGHKQEDDYVVYQSAELTRVKGGAQMGVSALAGLAFLADGHMPDEPKFGPTLDRAIEYVLGHQTDFGYFEDGGSRMYSHSFATLFLSQAHGMAPARAEAIAASLTRAAEFLQQAQNENGGWRYQPFTVECDLSVTVCQVQALRAARDAGVKVAAGCIDRVVDYVRASRIPSGYERGQYWYKIYGRAACTKTSFTVNAAAVTSLQSAGKYDEAEFGPALDAIAAGYELNRQTPRHFYYWYGNYYAAQALHAAGGERWRTYWKKLSADLLAHQQEDGRWLNDVGPGDAFATAVACLLLRVPAQYLPIFQR